MTIFKVLLHVTTSGAKIQKPASKQIHLKNSKPKNQAPNKNRSLLSFVIWNLSFVIWFLLLGSWFLVPGYLFGSWDLILWFLFFGSWFFFFGSCNLAFGILVLLIT